MSWLSEAIGGSAGEIIKSVGEVADKFITTDQDRILWETKKSELSFQFKKLEFDVEESLLKDKQSAREMYKKDSSLQKSFALVFLSGYIILTCFIIYAMFSKSLPPMENWQVALISSVFTAMSTKVNTIVDFLFGASHKEEENNQIKNILEKKNG